MSTSLAIQIISICLLFLSVVVIPLTVAFIRMLIRWNRVEDRLDQVAKSVDLLVQNKDAVHQAMLTTMGEDRRATDRRLRWLEEHIWNHEGDKTRRESR